MSKMRNEVKALKKFRNANYRYYVERAYSAEWENTLDNLKDEIEDLTDFEMRAVLEFFLGDIQNDDKPFAIKWLKESIRHDAFWMRCNIGVENTSGYWYQERNALLAFFKATSLKEVQKQIEKTRSEMAGYWIRLSDCTKKTITWYKRGAAFLLSTNPHNWQDFEDELVAKFKELSPAAMDENNLKLGGDGFGIELIITNPYFIDESDALQLEFDSVPEWVIEFIDSVVDIINRWDAIAESDYEDEDYEDEDYDGEN